MYLDDEKQSGDGDGSGGEADGTGEVSEALELLYLGAVLSLYEGVVAAFGVSQDEDEVTDRRGKKLKPLIIGRVGVGVAIVDEIVELDDTGERTVDEGTAVDVDEEGVKYSEPICENRCANSGRIMDAIFVKRVLSSSLDMD